LIGLLLAAAVVMVGEMVVAVALALSNKLMQERSQSRRIR